MVTSKNFMAEGRAEPVVDDGGRVYDGFISYSHAADDLLAPRLQSALQRFAKPWWKRRAVRIFRDESSLSANPHLWSSITEALDTSGWFVLLLSPDAAQSEWVNQEIAYWVENRDPKKILPVVTDGTFGWTDGDVSGDAVPGALRGVFSEEPRWVDVRWAKDEDHLDLQDPRFADAIADIASTIRGIPKDDLASEEVRQHRRTVRTAWSAGVALIVLVVAATAFGFQSIANASRADENAATARSRELAASGINVLGDDPELSVLLALQSIRTLPEGVAPPLESIVALRTAIQAVNRDGFPIEFDEPTGWAGVSVDASHVAWISIDGTSLRMYDVSAGLETWRIETENSRVIDSVEFTRDGSQILVSEWPEQGDPSAEPARLRAFHVDTGVEAHSEEFRGCPNFGIGPPSPDGRLVPLILADRDTCDSDPETSWNLVLRDSETWEEALRVEAPGPSHVTWSVDPQLVAVSAYSGGIVNVYDTSNGDLVRQIDEDGFIATLSPDGKNLATMNFESPAVVVFDIETGAIAERYVGLEDQAFDLEYSTDGSLLVGGSRGAGVQVWDTRTGAVAHSMPATGGTIVLGIDVDHRRLVHVSDEEISVWDLADSDGPALAGTAADNGLFGGTDVSAQIVFGEGGPELQFIDAARNTPLESPILPIYADTATELPDGRWVYVARDGGFDDPAMVAGPLAAFDLATGDSEAIFGCRALWAELREEVSARFGDCEEGSGAWVDIDRVFVDPSGATLAVSTRQEKAFVLDAGTFEVVGTSEFPDVGGAHQFGGSWFALSSNPNGNTSATESYRIVDLDGEIVAEFPGFESDLSEDGALLAVYDGPGQVSVYDTETWQPVSVLQRGSGRIIGLEFSPDGQRLLTTSTEGFARVWDVQSGLELHRIPVSASDGLWLDETTIGVGSRDASWTTITLDLGELIDLALDKISRGFTQEDCAVYRIDPCPSLEDLRDG